VILGAAAALLVAAGQPQRPFTSVYARAKRGGDLMRYTPDEVIAACTRILASDPNV